MNRKMYHKYNNLNKIYSATEFKLQLTVDKDICREIKCFECLQFERKSASYAT